MQVLEHLYPNVVILELTDRLTVETETDLKDAVRRQLDAGRRHLVLDLARVPYVDSCGLGTMVQAYVSAHRQGGSVKLMNVNSAGSSAADDHASADGLRAVPARRAMSAGRAPKRPRPRYTR